MPKRSAGLLLYRSDRAGEVEVLLVHPGGPYWMRKDDGAWSIPKGEVAADENPLAAARREFEEETGTPPPSGEVIELGEARQAGGKVVIAFAVSGEFDPGTIRSNTFEMEWPPRSGSRAVFPEIDRAAWFGPEAAKDKLVPGQRVLVDRLLERL